MALLAYDGFELQYARWWGGGVQAALSDAQSSGVFDGKWSLRLGGGSNYYTTSKWTLNSPDMYWANTAFKITDLTKASACEPIWDGPVAASKYNVEFDLAVAAGGDPDRIETLRLRKNGAFSFAGTSIKTETIDLEINDDVWHWMTVEYDLQSTGSPAYYPIKIYIDNVLKLSYTGGHSGNPQPTAGDMGFGSSSNAGTSFNIWFDNIIVNDDT